MRKMQMNKSIKLNFKYSQFNQLDDFVNYLSPFIKDMKHVRDYESQYAPLHLVNDTQFIQESQRVSQNLKSVDVLVVVGIGGSNLGTQAIYEAMQSSKMNELKTLLFADTTDSAMLNNLINLLKMLHDNENTIAINVISKSGTTTETLANFYVLYDALKQIEEGTFESGNDNSNSTNSSSQTENENTKNGEDKSEETVDTSSLNNDIEDVDKSKSEDNKKEGRGEENPEEDSQNETQESEGNNDTFAKTKLALHERIIVTTDKGSKLYIIGKQQGFKVLTIPKHVGGRYSVFSNVGLFPLSFSGLNIEELLRGAKEIQSQCLQTKSQNPAIMSATAMYLAKKRGQSVVNMFVFSTYLKSLGAWYRQLFAESLGKKMNSSETREVRSGMMPIVSVGSTDLHSVAQLFLGGPNMTYHQFVTIGSSNSIEIKRVPQGFEFLLPSIFEKSVDFVMDSIYTGVERAFVKEKIPFDHFHMNEINEYSLGAFMQFKMIEVMLLAKLWSVNAFNQPSVELYKQETRKLLEEE